MAYCQQVPHCEHVPDCWLTTHYQHIPHYQHVQHSKWVPENQKYPRDKYLRIRNTQSHKYPRANQYLSQGQQVHWSHNTPEPTSVTEQTSYPHWTCARFLPSAILLNKFFHKSTKSLTIATLLKSTSLFKSTKPLAINPILKNTSLFKSTKLLARKTLQTPTFPLPSKKDCYVRYSPFSICEVSGFLHNFP